MTDDAARLVAEARKAVAGRYTRGKPVFVQLATALADALEAAERQNAELRGPYDTRTLLLDNEALLNRAEQSEARLARVAALPAKWRVFDYDEDRSDEGRAWAAGREVCANDLESALASEEAQHE